MYYYIPHVYLNITRGGYSTTLSLFSVLLFIPVKRAIFRYCVTRTHYKYKHIYIDRVYYNSTPIKIHML